MSTTSVDVATADGIGTLILDHPPLNILTRSVLADLRGRLAELAVQAERGEIGALLLGAAGRHFSAGADVGEHLPPEFELMIPEFLDTVEAIADFPQPVIAAVRGRCLGGGFELVQAADLVVAADDAVFGQPEIALGVSPPAACALLPGLLGPALAAELVLTGDPLSAERAHEAGLVARLVPADQVEAAARELAGRIARHSPTALRLTKKALRAGTASARHAALRSSGRIYVDELMATADAVEGLTAFLDKRTPEWTGR
ncbi:MAG: enoyl-CoA hydratase-related protein [Gemmatimonadales bacterium]|jgi:cyclohexa-1,5-dienecarbonyl-CoA hydratase